MTENCRVKTARFFAGTVLVVLPPPAFFGSALAAAFSLAGVIFVTCTCSRRSADTAASIESAVRSPVTVSPARVRPV